MSNLSFNCRLVSQGCKNNKGQGYTTDRCRNEHETKRCYYNPQSLNYGKDQKANEEKQRQHINNSIKNKLPPICFLDNEHIKIKSIDNINSN